MSGFTAAAVSTLDFDFTGIPSQSNPGLLCTGKGVVAEPTDVAMVGFFTELDALQKGIVAAVESGADANTESINAMRKACTTFCGGTPTEAEIAELPPRYLAAFCRWIQTELGGGDPKG
jgi:hypothetical protein